MLIRLLGPFDVDGLDSRALGGPRQQSVLALLALRQGDVVTRDHLVDQIWVEPPGRPISVLQVYVSHLRSLLGGSPASIETVGGGYRLVGPDDLVDSRRFESLLVEAEPLMAMGDRARVRRAIDLLGAALGLFRGRALETFGGQPFAGPASTRLEELRLRALVARLSGQLSLGEHEVVLPELEAAVAEHPFRERFAELLMLALYRGGRQADALQVFQRTRRRLVEELGVSPGPELVRLEAAVLHQDPGLLLTAAGAEREVVPARPVPVEAVADLTRLGRWPTPGTTFVGRGRELGLLAELAVRHRLVTLTGVGGVGKTRLAVEAVSRLGGRLGLAEAVFVDATPAAGLDGLLSGFSSALGNNAVAAGVAQLCAELAGRPALVLIDRAEHVLEPLSRLLVELSARCSELRVLVTSRQPVGLAIEHAFEVPPMSLAPPTGEGGDAVELFAERTRRLPSADAPSPDWRATVASLCRQLDGLPLAIEVVAGMSESLTLPDLAERIGGTLRLEAPQRWSDDRVHRTLAAAMAWSYDLLEPDEQALFRALGVFPAAFDLAAAEKVAAGAGLAGSRVPLLLAHLVDRSLVPRPRHGAPRPYRMLETVSLFASERLRAAEDEHRAVSELHARLCLDVAAEAGPGLVGPRPAEWLGRVDELEADLRAAVAWWRREGAPGEACRIGLVLGTHHLYRFRLQEGRALVAELVENEPFAPPAERCQGWWLLASLEVMADDFEAAARDCEAGIALARETGCERELGALLARRAEVFRNRERDTPASRRLLEEAAGLAARLEDLRVEAEVLRMVTMLDWDAGHLEAALTAAQRWRAIGLRLGDPRTAADATTQLGGIAVALGRYEEGERWYREVAGFFAETGDPLEVAYSVYCRARAVHQEGRYEAAAELAAEALALFERIGDAWGRSISHRAAGQAAHALGRLRQAEEHLLVALDLGRSLGYPDDLAATMAALGALVLDTGDPARAEQLANEGLATLDPSTPSRHRGPLRILTALAALRSGDLARARTRLAAAEAECERSGWAAAREQLESARKEAESAEMAVVDGGEEGRSLLG